MMDLKIELEEKDLCDSCAHKEICPHLEDCKQREKEIREFVSFRGKSDIFKVKASIKCSHYLLIYHTLSRSGENDI